MLSSSVRKVPKAPSRSSLSPALTTTTVAVSGGDEALLPVRTAEAIPLELHAKAMDLIRGLVVKAPIRMGDVVLPNLLDTGTDLIASMDIDPA